MARDFQSVGLTPETRRGHGPRQAPGSDHIAIHEPENRWVTGAGVDNRLHAPDNSSFPRPFPGHFGSRRRQWFGGCILPDQRDSVPWSSVDGQLEDVGTVVMTGRVEQPSRLGDTG